MKRKAQGCLLHLQDYGSSDSEDEIQSKSDKTRLPAPKLPQYNECQSILREPKVENINRVRSFPHEPGNWATYVYVPISPSSDFQDFLQSLIKELSHLELCMVDDFHVSVTKTVVLRHHWIKDFIDSIGRALSIMNSFFINLSSFKVYTNENKTRTFVALEVTEGTKELHDIVNVLDKCLAEYKLPSFYKMPSFHTSILWCSGNKSEIITNCLNKLPFDLKTYSMNRSIDHVKCTTGNKTFNLNFESKNFNY